MLTSACGFVPFKSGSILMFPVEFYPLIAGMLYQAREYTPLIRKSIEVFLEFLELKKVLKGKSPEKVVRTDEKCLVKAVDGSTINIHVETFNLFQNNGTANASFGEAVSSSWAEDKSVERYQVHPTNPGKELFGSDPPPTSVL